MDDDGAADGADGADWWDDEAVREGKGVADDEEGDDEEEEEEGTVGLAAARREIAANRLARILSASDWGSLDIAVGEYSGVEKLAGEEFELVPTRYFFLIGEQSLVVSGIFINEIIC